MSDTLIEAVIASLKTCLCNAVQLQPNPPQHCCYRMSGEVGMDVSAWGIDMCCEGLAYVSFGDSWVSSVSFPDEDQVRQASASCPPPTMGIELKMGIIRCVPTGTDTSPPTCNEYTQTMLQSVYDNKSLWTAACCFRSGYQSLDPQLLGMSVILRRQPGNTPQGGCQERYMLIQAQVPLNCYGC